MASEDLSGMGLFYDAFVLFEAWKLAFCVPQKNAMQV